MKKKEKIVFTKLTQKKGISLISLTITIIVSLILLAAVTLSLSNTDMLDNASDVTYETDRDTMQSILEMTVSNIAVKKKSSITLDQGPINETVTGVSKTEGRIGFTTRTGKVGQIVFGEGEDTEDIFYTDQALPVYSGDTTWYIDGDGKMVLQIGDLIYGGESVPENAINASRIKLYPEKYYGMKVNNYECENSDTKWKIFHSNGKNIYLIADDYIPYSYMPATKTGLKLNQVDNEYKAYFTDVLPDYPNAASITSSTLRKELTYLKVNGLSSNTNNNIRSVAYMLDTNIWSKFKGDRAIYATGGPTLDLFVESYNTRYPDKKIEYISEGTGYKLRWDTGTETDYAFNISGVKTDNSLYVITGTSRANGIWLASPSAYNNNNLLNVNNLSCINYTYSSNTPLGFRPLVCLESGITLEEQDDGTYNII